MSRTPVAPAQAASTLNFIDGAFVAAASGKTFENRSPVDARLLGLVSEAGEAEVDRAVKAARAALAGAWGALEMAERTELLYAVANEINRRFDQFLEAEVADTGKPASLAKHIDIPRGAANFKIFADVVKNVPSEFFHMATPDKKGAINYAMRVPRGVIAVIAPWNLPLLLMTWKVGPALVGRGLETGHRTAQANDFPAGSRETGESGPVGRSHPQPTGGRRRRIADH